MKIFGNLIERFPMWTVDVLVIFSMIGLNISMSHTFFFPKHFFFHLLQVFYSDHGSWIRPPYIHRLATTEIHFAHNYGGGNYSGVKVPFCILFSHSVICSTTPPRLILSCPGFCVQHLFSSSESKNRAVVFGSCFSRAVFCPLEVELSVPTLRLRS